MKRNKSLWIGRLPSIKTIVANTQNTPVSVMKENDSSIKNIKNINDRTKVVVKGVSNDTIIIRQMQFCNDNATLSRLEMHDPENNINVKI